MKLLVFSTTYGFNQTDILVTDAVSYILSRHPEGLSILFFSILTAPNKLLHWKIIVTGSLPAPCACEEWMNGLWYIFAGICPPHGETSTSTQKTVYIKSHTHIHTHNTHICVIPWSLGSQLDILILRFTIIPLREIKIWIEIPSQVNQTLVT